MDIRLFRIGTSNKPHAMYGATEWDSIIPEWVGTFEHITHVHNARDNHKLRCDCVSDSDRYTQSRNAYSTIVIINIIIIINNTVNVIVGIVSTHIVSAHETAVFVSLSRVRWFSVARRRCSIQDAYGRASISIIPLLGIPVCRVFLCSVDCASTRPAAASDYAVRLHTYDLNLARE